jgi:hypothetical protein
MDVPRVIPCMPGTELTEAVDDANWKAKMTVKLGPMSFAFATDVKREEADEAARRARLSARAREERGRGGGQKEGARAGEARAGLPVAFGLRRFSAGGVWVTGRRGHGVRAPWLAHPRLWLCGL